MNVPQTQPSLVRAADVAALLAIQQQAAELAQRQQALSATREAAHSAASVAQATGSAETAGVGQRQNAPENEDQRGRRSRAVSPEEEPPIKDAPNIGPLGHNLDIIA